MNCSPVCTALNDVCSGKSKRQEKTKKPRGAAYYKRCGQVFIFPIRFEAVATHA